MSDVVVRCDRCDLPVDGGCGCGVVAREAAIRQAERSRALALPGVIASRHPGTCPVCRTHFSAGTPIRHTEDGWVGVLCCPETVG